MTTTYIARKGEQEDMNRKRFGVSIPKRTEQILDEYCKKENRTRSNMLDVMIQAYDELHKTKY